MTESSCWSRPARVLDSVLAESMSCETWPLRWSTVVVSAFEARDDLGHLGLLVLGDGVERRHQVVERLARSSSTATRGRCSAIGRTRSAPTCSVMSAPGLERVVPAAHRVEGDVDHAEQRLHLDGGRRHVRQLDRAVDGELRVDGVALHLHRADRADVDPGDHDVGPLGDAGRVGKTGRHGVAGAEEAAVEQEDAQDEDGHDHDGDEPHHLGIAFGHRLHCDPPVAATAPLTAWRSWPRVDAATELPLGGAAGRGRGRGGRGASGLPVGGLPSGPDPAGGLFGS